MKEAKPPKKRTLLCVTAVLFILFFTTVLISGFVLKRGFQLKSFSLGPASIKGFSLRWDNKLKLNIHSILLNTTTPSSDKAPKTGINHKAISASNILLKLFSEISVDTIHIQNQVIGFQFKTSQEQSFITLNSTDFTYYSAIAITQDSVTIDNAQFSSNKFDSKGTGSLSFNRSTKSFIGSINATIASSVPITVDFSGDNSGLTFNGKETGEILTITPLVDLFGLNQNIQRWITDYLTGSRYILNSFSGVIPWDNPAAILNSLKAQVEVVDCEYTFAQGLEPIKSKKTTVEFENGVLNIYPNTATFYNQSTGSSWLDINFNDPANILLTTYIKTSAVANKDIITLLNHYKIPLPFTQTAGKTETDLILQVNFRSKKVTVEGKLVIPAGTIQYKDAQYHITDADILLSNDAVSIIDLTMASGKMLEGKVQGAIRFSDKTGSLDITLKRFEHKFGKHELVLNDNEAAPTFKYNITPEKHWVDASPSSWLFNNKPFSIGSFSTPFIAKDLTVTLPTTTVSTPQSFIADISGTFSLVKKSVDAHCDLKHFLAAGVSLHSSTLPISIKFDKYLKVQTEAESTWEINGSLGQLSPIDISFEKDIVTWQQATFQLGESLSSEISGNYDLEKDIAELLLSELHIRSKSGSEVFNSADTIVVRIEKHDDAYLIGSPQLGASITVDANKNWQAKIEDFTSLEKYSKILQDYLPHGSKLTVSSTKNSLPYYFTANIPTNPPLITLGGNSLEQLDISGTIHPKRAQANINDAIKIDYGETLKIQAKSVDFDLTNIISLLKQRPGVNDNQEQKGSIDKLPIKMEAFDCNFLFGTGRKIISDEIKLIYDKGVTNAKLQRASSSITLALKDDLFSLESEKLSHEFVKSMLPNMKLQGGDFSFKIKGSFEEYSAIITMKDTLIKDYKPLTNTMALLDTIPALLTFSLPEYNSEGFPITSLTIALGIKNKVITVESFTLKSPVADLYGVGIINLKTNSIDMGINLITQAKTNTSKIPLIGYILVGDKKKPSVTIKISGDIDDPLVEHSTFEEIAKLPISMLKRTFYLPFRWTNSDN